MNMKIILILLASVFLGSPAFAYYQQESNPYTGLPDYVGVSKSADIGIVCASGQTLTTTGSGAWACGAGSTTPTGTGFTHINAGSQDAAARAVNLASADVTGVLPVSSGGTGVSSSTGSTAVVLSNSPTLVTPNIGAATGASLRITDGTRILDSTVTAGGAFIGTSSNHDLMFYTNNNAFTFGIGTDGQIALPRDSKRFYFGQGYDASLAYDGTNFLIKPSEVGTGYLAIVGNQSNRCVITNSLTDANTAPTTVATANYLQVGQNEYGASNGTYRLIQFGYNDMGASSVSPAYIGYQETDNGGTGTKGELVFGTRSSNGITTTPTEQMRITTSGAVNLTSTIGKYKNISTEGLGAPAVYKVGRATAQVAANTSVATYTTPASDGSYEVSSNVLVTTSTVHNFTVTVDYTDEGNTARTVTMPFAVLAGTFVTAITNASGAVPYTGIPIHLRCKASTAITVKTAGTFTTVVYNIEAIIKQTA